MIFNNKNTLLRSVVCQKIQQQIEIKNVVLQFACVAEAERDFQESQHENVHGIGDGEKHIPSLIW